MKKLPYLIITLLFTLNISAQYSKSFKYKWLNKKFPLTHLTTYEEDEFKLFDSNEYIYVISFWNTNCGPCIAEIPTLNKLKEDFTDYKIEFISISFDKKKDVDDFFNNNPFLFKHCYLPIKKIHENGLAIGYPTNLVINKKGKVKFYKTGGWNDHIKAKEIYKILSNEIFKLNPNKKRQHSLN